PRLDLGERPTARAEEELRLATGPVPVQQVVELRAPVHDDGASPQHRQAAFPVVPAPAAVPDRPPSGPPSGPPSAPPSSEPSTPVRRSGVTVRFWTSGSAPAASRTARARSVPGPAL